MNDETKAWIMFWFMITAGILSILTYNVLHDRAIVECAKTARDPDTCARLK